MLWNISFLFYIVKRAYRITLSKEEINMISYIIVKNELVESIHWQGINKLKKLSENNYY